MKNKKITLFLCLGLSVLLIGGCGKKDTTDVPAETATTEESTETIETTETEVMDSSELLEANGGSMAEVERPDMSKINFDEYVELGDYTTIEIEAVESEVADEDVDAYINNLLSSYAEYTDITDRPSEKGDQLTVSFDSTINGEAFDGGAAEHYTFILGNGEFLKDFETPLYNVNVGDIVTADVLFPDDYAEAVAGKEAEFTIVVESIKEVNVPELSTEIISELSETASTEADLREEVRHTLQAAQDSSNKDTVYSDILIQLSQICTVKDYPEGVYNYYANVLRSYYSEYATAYGLSLTDFLTTYCEMTQEEFDTECDSYAKEASTQSLILYAIADKEKLSLTDEEYEASLTQLATDYGYDSVDVLKEEIASYNGDYEMKENLLFDKVCEKIIELCK